MENNKNNLETKQFETTLHLSSTGEFNLKSILDLLEKNSIKIKTIGASNPRPNSEYEVTEDNIPVGDVQLTLEAPLEKIREIILNSEFKDKIDTLLGHGLN